MEGDSVGKYLDAWSWCGIIPRILFVNISVHSRPAQNAIIQRDFCKNVWMHGPGAQNVELFRGILVEIF